MSLQVGIEYGRCEMLNGKAIRTPPRDEDWGFDISKIKSMLPAGTANHSVESGM